ncbi:ester cyclase [Georgenia sp. AZ-5]|uniref:ester cyclase n=1 Tax=Georgenia sp. AZ-5 TaxID=3367526 RepID=UPI003753FC94
MMTTEERAGMIRRVLDALWNEGDLGACDELYAEHCSFHDPTFGIDGVQGLKDFVRELRMAEPDLHMNLHDVVVSEGMSAQRFTLGATHKGEFRGLPATGKTYVMTGLMMGKWEGDRIVEEWTNYDALGAFQQLGFIPERIIHESTA